MSQKDIVRGQLLKKGAANLREFGYETCKAEQVLEVDVFRRFFKSMLEEAQGQGSGVQQLVVKELLAEIETKDGAQ